MGRSVGTLGTVICLLCASIGLASASQPCKLKEQFQPNDQVLFLMNNQPLQTNTLVAFVEEASPDECWLNTTQLVSSLKVGDVWCFRTLAIGCRRPLTVHAHPYTGPKLDHVIVLLQASHCSMDTNSLLNLGAFGNLKVLIFSDGTLETANDTVSMAEVHDNILENVVSFSFEGHGGSGAGLDQLLSMHNASKTFDFAEMDVGNVSWTFTEDLIRAKFPVLQSLTVSGLNLTSVPMHFPYTQELVSLPNNLTRSLPMQHHYMTSEFINAPTDVFRRIWNLDYNRIQNLTYDDFQGSIQKLSLRHNVITTIDQDTFVNISDLQNLDLSYNQIEHLPAGVFRNQSLLRNLNLNNNNLTNITTDVFQDLTHLVRLNLADNMIEFIAAKSFINMLELESLRLENNQLLQFDAECFRLYPLGLTEIYLQNNRLTKFPEWLLYVRGLKKANLNHNTIRFDNFTSFLEELIVYKLGEAVVDSASDSDMSDLLVPSAHPVLIDLGSNNISSLSLTGNEATKVLRFLLLHYRFDLSNNPLLCSCHINSFVENVNGLIRNGTLRNELELFKTWLCSWPEEFKGTMLYRVEPGQTYCHEEMLGCPGECTCYRRAASSDVIVDCRSRQLGEIHTTLPTGALELWYSNNSITTVNNLPNPGRILVLDVSHNSIVTIGQDLFHTMTTVRKIDLRYNLLTSLPPSIKSTSTKSIWIHPNPFPCDCHTLWLKQWILQHKDIVPDWHRVTCVTEDTDGYILTKLDDYKFICKSTESSFDEVTHVIIPATLSSVSIACVIVIIALLYVFRLEVKVLLFVYTGAHPFDKSSGTGQEDLDCVIVHSGNQTDWVMERLVPVLEDKDYRLVVCDMARDFVVGYSLSENLRKTVTYSKQIVFLITPDWMPGKEGFTVAWSIANEKIQNVRFEFGIVITHEVNKADITDKEVHSFLKHGRYIDSSDRLFNKKLIYFMPIRLRIESYERYRKSDEPTVSGTMERQCYMNKVFDSETRDNHNMQITVAESDVDIGLAGKFDVFLSYGDEDQELAIQSIGPLLEKNNLKCLIPDRDFLVGASKEENILCAIEKCRKTVYVLSSSYAADEWSLFTFRAAYEKSLRESTNHLIVILRSDLDTETDIIDDEMMHYIRKYICLKDNDRWFQQKLLHSVLLSVNKYHAVRDHVTDTNEIIENSL